MNMKQHMRNLLVVAVVGASLWTPRAALALEDNGGYVISEVVARQRWPWERKVDIDFRLTKPAWAPSDRVVRIGVVASNDTREVAVSYASLAGTAALPGISRRIVWDPTLDHPNKSFPQLKFYLSVISTNVEPEYMVIDLANGDIEYKDEYFAEEVNAGLYKTAKMAFRYIQPGAFTMGEGAGKATTLTKGFYMGVFEVTQAQWQYVTGGVTPASRFKDVEPEMRPKETVSYNDIRGSDIGAGWPASSEVDPGSFLGVLRSRTSINELDLPTEAQWEYACRAGTTTYYSDGAAAAPSDGVSLNTGESNAFINVLGRYKYNGGNIWNGSTWADAPAASGPANGTAIVGSYLPNAWGLYDMHGNVYEWVLDWNAALVGGVDPKGAAAGSVRVIRGGSWHYAASDCRSASRSDNTPSSRYFNNGFRLVRTLP